MMNEVLLGSRPSRFIFGRDASVGQLSKIDQPAAEPCSSKMIESGRLRSIGECDSSCIFDHQIEVLWTVVVY